MYFHMVARGALPACATAEIHNQQLTAGRWHQLIGSTAYTGLPPDVIANWLDMAGRKKKKKP